MSSSVYQHNDDSDLTQSFPYVSSDTPSEKIVFLGIDGQDDDDSDGMVIAAVDEDYFIGRGAPSRTSYHFRNLVNHQDCDCPFCDWFRANLILD